MTTSEALPDWADYLAKLEAAGELVDLVADPADLAARQGVWRLLFLSLAAGFNSAFMDPDLPDFTPITGNVLNALGTNPDFIYAGTAIDGTGQYRLSGERGEGLFLLFDISSGGMLVNAGPGVSLGMIDVDAFTVTDGRFDVLLSSERPAGYDGDWFRLDPSARSINVRQASYDWGEEREARIAIERIDRPIAPRRLDAAEVSQRLTALTAFPARMAGFALGYGAGQRSRGVLNSLEHDDWAGRGGVTGQHYWQGAFKLEPGQAMLIETDVPETVRYWNIQLNDPLWNTIDWFNRQSSLNGGQARIDSDGRFRAVISPQDPGVPNWLDTGEWLEGSLMLRWLEASSSPEPSLKVVPLSDVRAQLPADTPVVASDMRQEALRRRRRGAQLRRRW